MSKKMRLWLVVALMTLGKFAQAVPPVLSERLGEGGAELAFVQDEMPSSVYDVIKWNARVESDGCDATLIVEVTQLNGWHIYSQILPPDAMNIPTTFTFENEGGLQLVGKVTEPATHVEDNDGFPERPFHGEKVVFKQKLKVTDSKAHKLKGSVEFMACKTSCFPPDYWDFEVTVPACDGSSTPEDTNDEGEDPEGEGEDPEETTDTAEVADGHAIDDMMPVEGTVEFKMTAFRIAAKEFEIQIEVAVDSGWTLVGDGLSNKSFKPLSLKIQDGPNMKLEGELEGPKLENKVIEGFGEVGVYTGPLVFRQKLSVEDTSDLPQVKAAISYSVVGEGQVLETESEVSLSFDLSKAPETIEATDDKGFWTIFVLAFLGGLAALC